MKNSCFNLLGLAHVPEVLTEISACSSGHVHLVVFFVTTLRTFPFAVIIYDYLTVISTYVAIIRLGVELGVLYVVIYISYDFCQSIQIVSHIRYLYI